MWQGTEKLVETIQIVHCTELYRESCRPRSSSWCEQIDRFWSTEWFVSEKSPDWKVHGSSITFFSLGQIFLLIKRLIWVYLHSTCSSAKPLHHIGTRKLHSELQKIAWRGESFGVFWTGRKTNENVAENHD